MLGNNKQLMSSAVRFTISNNSILHTMNKQQQRFFSIFNNSLFQQNRVATLERKASETQASNNTQVAVPPPKFLKQSNDTLQFVKVKPIKKSTALAPVQSSHKHLVKGNRLNSDVKNARKLTDVELQQASKQLTVERIMRSPAFLPFTDTEKLLAWKRGDIVPAHLQDTLLVQDTKEGNTRIVYTEDMNFDKMTAELLAPQTISPAERVAPLMNINTDMDVFFANRHRNVTTFNLLIYCMAVQGKKDEAINALLVMKEHGIQPDAHSYASAMKACAEVGDHQSAALLFQRMADSGLKPMLHNYSVLVNALVRGKKLNEAFDVVHTMMAHNVQTDIVIHTNLLVGCINEGNLTRAWDHQELMMSTYHVEPDEVTYSILINAAAEAGEAERAMRLFDQILEKKLTPTDVAYNTVIKAFAKRRELYKKCFEMADRMEANGYKADIITYSTLLHVCARNGDTDQAYKLLDKMRQNKIEPNEYVYNTMFSVFAKQNMTNTKRQKQNLTNAVALYEQMKSNMPEKVNNITVNSVLQVFSNALRLNSAMDFFKAQYKEMGLKPDAVTYTILISMYARAKRPTECVALLNEMKQVGLKPTYNAYKHCAFTFARYGKHEEAKQWLSTMHEEGGYMLRPNDVKLFRQVIKATAYRVRDAEMDIKHMDSIMDILPVGKENIKAMGRNAARATMPMGTKSYKKQYNYMKRRKFFDNEQQQKQ